LADIDALIDSAARARLRRAVQEAVRCPSPARLAALSEWPRAWVAEEDALCGDRLKRIADRRKCRGFFWKWIGRWWSNPSLRKLFGGLETDKDSERYLDTVALRPGRCKRRAVFR